LFDPANPLVLGRIAPPPACEKTFFVGLDHHLAQLGRAREGGGRSRQGGCQRLTHRAGEVTLQHPAAVPAEHVEERARLAGPQQQQQEGGVGLEVRGDLAGKRALQAETGRPIRWRRPAAVARDMIDQPPPEFGM